MSPPALWLAVSLVLGAPPTQNEATRAEDARTIYQRAKAEFENGNFTAAAEAFVEAHELSGKPNLLYNAALAYEEAEDYPRALEYMQKYLPLAPPDEHEALDAEIRVLSRRAQAQTEAKPSVVRPDEAIDPVPPPRVKEPRPPVVADTDERPQQAGLFGPAEATLTALTVVGTGLAVGFGVAAQRAKQQAYDACERNDGATVCKEDAQAASVKFRRFAAVTDASIVIAAVSAVALATVLGVKAVRRAKARQSRPGAVSWRLGGLAVGF